MNSIADELKTSVICYCSAIGKDPLLVQGAGGNVSWKEGSTLWIKASGTWLAQAAEKEIFVPVDLPLLRSAIESGDFTVTPRVLGKSALRPSIETLLHAMMPHRVVVHLHVIEILAHLVRENCQTDFQSLIDESIHWIMVDYHKPGAALATAVSTSLTEVSDANVVFLKNHGVVIGGADVAEVNHILTMLTTNLRIIPVSICSQTQPPLPTEMDQYISVQDADVHQLALNMDLYNRLDRDWALYPDHVVFLGERSYVYRTWNAFREENRVESELPELVFILDKGVFVKPTFSKAKLEQLRCYYDVLIRQKDQISIKALTKEQILVLLNWDAEQYRINLSN